MLEGFSGVSPDRLIEVSRAREQYDLQTRNSLFASPVHNELAENGIVKIHIPLSESDFKSLLAGYEVCIEEFPELLAQTLHDVDTRFGNQAGHERKEQEISKILGKQVRDPKNLMHFNEYARIRWDEEFVAAPKDFKAFLADGYEAHQALISVARSQFEELEETHPGIVTSHFPGNEDTPHASHTYMRLLRYDGYQPSDELGEVAKPHYDISGATIQAFSDAPGFWGAKDGRNGERTYCDTGIEEGYLFMGKGYQKLYPKDGLLKPLYHGVDRIVPEGATYVPPRHAVILFIDSPFIDYAVKPEDTLPELHDTHSDVNVYRAEDVA